MLDPSDKTAIDNIWRDDLFERKGEAELLIGYLESVAGRGSLDGDHRAYTVAVDAGYGEGKTFFLKRLGQTLQLRHPVAFIDAWADDLSDEPLTALAATLKAALDPFIKSSSEVNRRWSAVVEKTGKVAAIAGKGLVKRGLGLLITGAAVEAADQVISGVSEATEAALQDGLKEGSKEAVDGAGHIYSTATSRSLMERRIETFEEGRRSIAALKSSLAALVEALSTEPIHPPIFIIIDELDRCRPTYAIKLLEEIKHLFDVPGLIFVLGLNGSQLSRSISGAYGPEFDGASYLQRFIDRRYHLREPDLTPLVRHLLLKSGVPLQKLVFPLRVKDWRGIREIDHATAISAYFDSYGLSARDTFKVMDIIQTSASLTKDNPLLMGYLLPLIIGSLSGDLGEMIPPKKSQKWNYVFNNYETDQPFEIDLWGLAQQFERATTLNESALMKRLNNSGDDIAGIAVYEATINGRTRDNPLADPRDYPQLLRTVGRFENPALQ